MPVKLYIYLLFIGLFFFFSGIKAQQIINKDSKNNIAALKLYNRAGQLFNKSARIDDTKQQDNINEQCLALYKLLIKNDSLQLTDSLIFHCYVKAGLLNHYFDRRKEARVNYNASIAAAKNVPGLPDSFLFKPYLFSGSLLYDDNEFDSALVYYNYAEKIVEQYNNPLEDIERLYNRMGVMYYETGNYKLANNYFEKAVNTLSASNPFYSDLLINYKMNIASNMVRLEEYQKALDIFQSILSYKIHTNEIHHNIGIIKLRTGNFKSALDHFETVVYPNNAKSIELFTNKAEAFSNLLQHDSADYYINKAMIINSQVNGKRKSRSYGITLKLTGDEKVKQGNKSEALSYYQQALCQFFPAYNDLNIYNNPEKYTGAFSYINLFNTLAAKADAFNKIYENSKLLNDLQASFNAYKSAFVLAEYVAKTYNSDEARLFLNKIKYGVHDKAIQSGLALYDLTHDKAWLEQAYYLDQKNKASALTLSVQESNYKKEIRRPVSSIENEFALRSQITRLSLKAIRITDANELAEINNEISDDEIKLARLQQQMQGTAAYKQMPSSIHVPSYKELQAMLDDETSLLSYHVSSDNLVIFCVNKHSFDFVKQPLSKTFFTDVKTFVNNLHQVGGGGRYSGSTMAVKLYQTLVRPVLPMITATKKLVIIPDDELNYVPFEALEDDGKYLLQTYDIQYQYSTALLQLKSSLQGELNNKQVLAFAPFTKTIAGNGLQPLPYSKEEISGLTGKIFYDDEATKQHFIDNANHYQVVHLATHAAINDSMPMASYIAFYPAEKDNDEAFLYAREIYDLDLDSTQLVILSACETGNGELVQGEGIMSITRAFAYAGCTNMVTSLWKASDRTTAFITSRLHYYLNKGYTKSRALQFAKLDLLANDDIPASLKTPNYWAHIILIGNYDRQSKSYYWLWIAAAIAIVIAGFLIIKKRSAVKQNV